MLLKRESRLLVIDRIGCWIIGIVVRGVLGIENAIVLSNCNELLNF